MLDRGYQFLSGVLGVDGASAFRKALESERTLAAALVPRAILSWLGHGAGSNYRGEIPGVGNTYLKFAKSESGYSGAVTVGTEVYDFDSASVFHLAGAMSLALGVNPEAVSDHVRARTLQRLGKSVDTLVKAQIALRHLENRVLDPALGYQFQVLNQRLQDGGMLTRVVATHPQDQQVGTSLFKHQGQNLIPAGEDIQEKHRHLGLASAMSGQAERHSGKKVVSKVELPGQANKPTQQQQAQAPVAPEFQPRTPKPLAKKPKLAVTKSESEVKCSFCRRPQFQAGQFQGCLCFSSMTSGAAVRKTEVGYEIEFLTPDWDRDAVAALQAAFRGEK